MGEITYMDRAGQELTQQIPTQQDIETRHMQQQKYSQLYPSSMFEPYDPNTEAKKYVKNMHDGSIWEQPLAKDKCHPTWIYNILKNARNMYNTYGRRVKGI